jgi:hypothetical protein
MSHGDRDRGGGLVEGHRRLGATFGREPVVDSTFGATDFLGVQLLSDVYERELDCFRSQRSRRRSHLETDRRVSLPTEFG